MLDDETTTAAAARSTLTPANFAVLDVLRAYLSTADPTIIVPTALEFVHCIAHYLQSTDGGGDESGGGALKARKREESRTPSVCDYRRISRRAERRLRTIERGAARRGARRLGFLSSHRPSKVARMFLQRGCGADERDVAAATAARAAARADGAPYAARKSRAFGDRSRRVSNRRAARRNDGSCNRVARRRDFQRLARVAQRIASK